MLDRKNTDRSYLFGRYEACVEEMQNYVVGGTQIVTNDAKNISIHPQRLLKLHQKLLDMPHKDIEEYRILEMMIAEILDLFEYSDFLSNEKLDELHTLGYWHQKSELKLLKIRGLSNVRKLRGLTQSELAEKMGCTQKDISRWETGERNPNIINLIKLAEILNCEMKNLI